MKRWAIGSVAFLVTFAAGSLASLPTIPEVQPNQPPPDVAIPHQIEPPQPERKFTAEFQGISIDSLFPLDNWNEKLLDEPNLDFFPEDIVTKSGQLWLAAEESNKGEIRFKRSPLKITKGQNDGMTVSLRFEGVSDPIFAVRDLKNIRPGKVNTLHFNRSNSHDEDTRPKMTSAYRQEFDLNGKKYYLRVAGGTERDGAMMGFLVLGDGNIEQIIDYSPYWEEMELHLGILIWAGDMDQDGKLDLYIDRSYSEEKSGTALFLSSHASRGDLVKIAALFAHAGC